MEENKVNFQKKKLFYVLTSAGKPVWCRYGDESDLSTFIGTLAAIIFKFQHYYDGVSDSLRYLRTKDMNVVFLCTEVLYYVCISRGSSSLQSLYYQLQLLHKKVISTLTDNVSSMLLTRPNYDVRSLMGGTDASLRTLIKTSSVSPGFLEGIMPVRMLAAHRGQLHNCFRNNSHEDILYGYLMTTDFIIYSYTRRGEVCFPVDAMLLNNLVASYTSLRSSMSWAPICFPDFSEQGFVYAYISFLQGSNIGLVLISDDASAFTNLKQAGDQIEREIKDSEQIQNAIDESVRNTPYSVKLTETKELRHFLYHSKAAEQYTMSGFFPTNRQVLEEMKLSQYRKTLKRYYSAYRLSVFPDYYKGYYFRVDNYRNEQVACCREKDTTLLASFSSLLPLGLVCEKMTQLLKWARTEEPNNFILK